MDFFTSGWVPFRVQVMCHKSGKIKEKQEVWKNYTNLDLDHCEYRPLFRIESYLFRHP